MYKVKHFSTRTGGALQYDISNWLETRNHIQIIQMNICKTEIDLQTYKTYLWLPKQKGG